MEMIRLDYERSECRTIEEQLAMGLMFAVHQPEKIISWQRPGDRMSYTVSFNIKNLRASISYTNKPVFDFSISILERFFGKPLMTFFKESSIDPGLIIYYMEWDGKVCDSIMQRLSNEEGSLV